MKPGDIVKYADPLEGEESIRFVVIEAFEDAQPPRIKVRLIDDHFVISPVSVLLPQELKLV